MQIAATEGMLGSPGLGRMPLAQRAATLPGVSLPSSVVRSMHRMARSSAHSFDAFLIERLASAAARSSAPTSSTLRTPRISEPRWDKESAVGVAIGPRLSPVVPPPLGRVGRGRGGGRDESGDLELALHARRPMAGHAAVDDVAPGRQVVDREDGGVAGLHEL